MRPELGEARGRRMKVKSPQVMRLSSEALLESVGTWISVMERGWAAVAGLGRRAAGRSRIVTLIMAEH